MKVSYFKCDRCGKTMNDRRYIIGIFNYKKFDKISVKSDPDVDLCEGCLKLLKRFFNNKDVKGTGN